MKVYDSVQDDGYEFLHPVAPEDYDSLERRVDEHVPGTEWIPRSLKLFREDEGKPRKRGDWLYLSHHIPVLRPAAALAVRHALDPGDQLLPMTAGKETLYFLKPRWTIDALDEAASDIFRLDDGRIGIIHEHVFRADAFSGQAIFFLPRIRSSACYLTDRFVDAWNAAGLTGLSPKLLWENP